MLATGTLLLPFFIEPLCKISSWAQGIYSLINNITSYSNCPSIINNLTPLKI